MPTTDTSFEIELSNFQDGLSALAHLDSRTFFGSMGQASEMLADIISNPSYINQSPALANLTNGTQAGVVDQLIRFILDRPTASNTTFAVGTTKLFKLSSTTVTSGGSPSWPQAITDMTEGESVIRLKANLFVFYNKQEGGDIAAMPLSTETIDPDWGSTTNQALEKAPHPSAAKEDILIFGNGRYVGVYVEGLAVLDVRKLDFGEGSEVADVVFNAGMWWIAVNYGEGRRGQVYLYDGSALSNGLLDETGLGNQRIGFLYVQNGEVYLSYEDKTSTGYAIGMVSGRSIKPLRHFTGSLPNHRQKTLYKNTILFVSGENVTSCGAAVEQLPIQVSHLADGGYANLGGIAAPFGNPIIASSDGTSNHRLAQFSGLSTQSSWKSKYYDTTRGRDIGKIHTIIITTKPLAEGARCDISLEGNQGQKTSGSFSITGTNKTKHTWRSVDLPAVEDFRAIVSYTNGSASVSCPIRKIEILGNFVER
jgi:hypothetical protein